MVDPLLVLLVGPTASGKTSLSIALAQQFNGEVVSCDSVSVYRELDIGSAKPSLEERALVPHHLIDVRDPNEAYTAGDYSREARAAIAEIAARRRLPIVVGGTGLYLRALIDGLFAGPQRDEALREHLRARAEAKGPAYVHHLLKRLDPAAATAIHENDLSKVIRAVEVCLAARQPITEAWREKGRDALTGYRIVRIGLDPDRKLLYERINQRAAAMFNRGLVKEAGAVSAKYGSRARSLTSLGYAQAMQLMNGEASFSDAVASAQQGHRNYAKRQLTWFRRDEDVTWLKGFGDEAETQKEVVRLVSSQL